MEEELTTTLEPTDTVTESEPSQPEFASSQSEPKWYVLHTYSGYENMVRDNLRMVFEKNNMLDRLVKIIIPMEDVVEEKNGKRKIVQRRMFPCYVLIKMVYDNSMWHMITNTRGVTGFVGPKGYPSPLTQEEIKRMHIDDDTLVVETDYHVGDRVKVTQGPLEGFMGEIDTIDAAAGKCRVTVSMFGRETPVDLELRQIEHAE